MFFVSHPPNCASKSRNYERFSGITRTLLTSMLGKQHGFHVAPNPKNLVVSVTITNLDMFFGLVWFGFCICICFCFHFCFHFALFVFTQVYLVPSMLMSEADSEILKLIMEADVPALVVRFPDEYLPFGMFPRLVTRCVHWCAKTWTVRKQPKFYKNYACFFLGTSGSYQVILASGLNVISVSVVRGRKVPEMSAADRLSHER